jgi:hypothetical protein
MRPAEAATKAAVNCMLVSKGKPLILARKCERLLRTKYKVKKIIDHA